jgi:hypothetical protein
MQQDNSVSECHSASIFRVKYDVGIGDSRKGFLLAFTALPPLISPAYIYILRNNGILPHLHTVP